MIDEDVEELQVKEFLKRTEVRTMKKDLQRLREGEALRERDKIANIKTIEQERAEKAAKEAAALKNNPELQQQAAVEKILEKNIEQEREAERQLKDYASEAEKQQIFLLESKRVGLKDQVDTIEKVNEPELTLDKNSINLEKGKWQARLNDLLKEEQKIEAEQKVLADRENTTNVPSERKALEKGRWDLEDQRQEIEKKRWAIEKEIQDRDNKIKELDVKLEKFTQDKQKARAEISEIDKELRDIYSKIVERVEQKRAGKEQEQLKARQEAAKLEKERKEKIQRQQWTKSEDTTPPEKEFMRGVNETMKEKLAKSAQEEEERRKQFLENINKRSEEEKQ
mgnify:CR=1 FL=1